MVFWSYLLRAGALMFSSVKRNPELFRKKLLAKPPDPQTLLFVVEEGDGIAGLVHRGGALFRRPFRPGRSPAIVDEFGDPPARSV